MSAAANRALAERINREIWNGQRLELIPECFTEDFVADYSPRVVRRGHDDVAAMVRAAHASFEGFREEIHQIIADDEHAVLHFTIHGRHVGDWGPLPATGRTVAYDEIVILRMRDGRVCHQVGVSDALLALQQIGAIPDPAGYTRNP